jgi:hypothetical protein
MVREDGTPCLADLRNAPVDILPSEHPVLHSQAAILAHLAPGVPDEDVRNFINDCRAIAVGVLREANFERLAIVSGLDAPLLAGLRQLSDETSAAAESPHTDTAAAHTKGSSATPSAGSSRAERTDEPVHPSVTVTRLGTSPPTDAAFLGALSTYAVHVLDDLGGPESTSLLVPVVDYIRAFSSEGTPSAVVRYMKAASPGLINEIRRDVTIHSIAEQLRLRAHHRAPVFMRSHDVIERRARHLPQLMFLDWSVALHPQRTQRSEAFRSSLSSATLIPGNPDRRLSVLNQRLGRVDAYRLRPRYFLGPDDRPRDTVLALCRLADYLDEYGAPIDYERRRRLKPHGFLCASDWLRFLEEGAHGLLETRHRARAQRFLWQRLTGSFLPTGTHFARPQEGNGSEHEMNYFLTKEAHARLEDYALAFIEEQGIQAEPLTWAPSLDLIPPSRHLGLAAARVLIRDVQQAVIRGENPALTAVSTGLPELAIDLCVEEHRLTEAQLLEGAELASSG